MSALREQGLDTQKDSTKCQGRARGKDLGSEKTGVCYSAERPEGGADQRLKIKSLGQQGPQTGYRKRTEVVHWVPNVNLRSSR